MKTPLTFLLSLTFLISMIVCCAESPPIDGWRYPNKSDMKDGWNDEDSHPFLPPVPYHFSADLNGDGLSDDAWMLISTYKGFEDVRWGLFVFFNQNTRPPIIAEYGRYWDKRVGYPNAPQSYYIRKYSVGEYSGIEISLDGVGSEGIYWDEKTSSFVVGFGYGH